MLYAYMHDVLVQARNALLVTHERMSVLHVRSRAYRRAKVGRDANTIALSFTRHQALFVTALFLITNVSDLKDTVSVETAPA